MFFLYDLPRENYAPMLSTLRAELPSAPDVEENVIRERPWENALRVQVWWTEDPDTGTVRGTEERIRDLAVAYDAVLDVRDIRSLRRGL